MAHGSIRHIEIAGRDGPKLEEFYQLLFGWRMKPQDLAGYRYTDVTPPAAAPGGPTGGIRHEPDGKPELVVYVEVDDLETTVDLAEDLGAEVRIPPTEHGGNRFALINDPEGNPIGLLAA